VGGSAALHCEDPASARRLRFRGVAGAPLLARPRISVRVHPDFGVAWQAMRAALALAVACLFALPGCKDRGTPDAAKTPEPPPPRTYTVRGEVAKLPAATAVGHWVAVRHEAIPEFVDASGAPVGMAAMRMVFDVAPSVPLDGLRQGDKIELGLTVGWAPPLLRVDALRKLPPETVLQLGPPRPAGPSEDQLRSRQPPPSAR
jgi:Cu/Ag efflux protein CusF